MFAGLMDCKAAMTPHNLLFAATVGAIGITIRTLDDPAWRSPNEWSKHFTETDWTKFPMLQQYQPVYDFVSTPMNPTLAIVLFIIDVWSILLAYYIERPAVKNAHKKYAAHGTSYAAMIHGIGSCVELAVGLAAVLRPDVPAIAKATAYIALLINLPSGWIMTPRVFGVRHLTVPGFSLQGVLRTMEALRVLTVDTRLVPNLWILLHVGTVVRLLGYFVLPYSTTDGLRGDLFTEPINYSFNILLSGILTAAFVYPPFWLLASHAPYVLFYFIMPPKIAGRLRPKAA
jgi:hypothetical protein